MYKLHVPPHSWVSWCRLRTRERCWQYLSYLSYLSYHNFLIQHFFINIEKPNLIWPINSLRALLSIIHLFCRKQKLCLFWYVKTQSWSFWYNFISFIFIYIYLYHLHRKDGKQKTWFVNRRRKRQYKRIIISENMSFFTWVFIQRNPCNRFD